jgi:hypothetical protein
MDHPRPLLYARHAAHRLRRRVAQLLGRAPVERPRDDCGDADPRPAYRDRSFAGGETSPDQRRIEAVLPGLVHADAALLHVGVGSSSLARAVAASLARIDGLTILADEKAVADGLGLPNYTVRLGNKYGTGLATLPGGYALIVDNNPASFACCRRHFAATMAAYARLLAPGGRLLTDRAGLAFHEPYAFGLGWRGWTTLGATHSLVPERITRSVWALRRPP